METEHFDKSRSPSSTDRRRLLGCCVAVAASASALSSADCFALGSQSIPGKWSGDFIIHDKTNWESRSASIQGDLVTPEPKLYVCSHLPIPSRQFVGNRLRWQLEIKGIRQAATLGVADLMKLGSTSQAMVLQCAGNGRRFFHHEPDGPDWGIGAAGCVVWTGVPVHRVVESLGGLRGRVRYATATGGEPVNALLDDIFSMRVERSIPIAKAMQDCLLAWELNGRPIPRVHGGPLRLIVPGYFGVNQIKYVRTLAFTGTQSDADIMQKDYRYAPTGESGSNRYPTTWEMPVKSWIWPVSRSPAATGTRLHGVAFGGSQPVVHVEISVDDGRSWKPASIETSALGPYAWRRFSFPLEMPRGNYRVACRARDENGNRQPEWHSDNAGGYANNGWRDMAIMVSIG